MTKLFSTLYRLDLEIKGLDIWIVVCQWNPYKEKLFIKQKNFIEKLHLEKFHGEVKRQLLNSGRVWLKDTVLDVYCDAFNWTKIEHFSGCDLCKGRRYIPLMNFYTGCHICNKDDKGSYTAFEAEEKTEDLLF